MDLTDIINKVNEIIDTNKKNKKALDVINTHLDDLETRVYGQQPNGNN